MKFLSMLLAIVAIANFGFAGPPSWIAKDTVFSGPDTRASTKAKDISSKAPVASDTAGNVGSIGFAYDKTDRLGLNRRVSDITKRSDINRKS